MTEELLDEEVLTVDHNNCRIVVHNDDVNSFEHVIQSFMDVLKHSKEQAEQLAMIIHTKGKANVKDGTFDELRPLCEALIDRDLSADIE